MKTQNLLLIPIVFVAGIVAGTVSLVLLERTGLVRINLAESNSSATSAGLSQSNQNDELSGEPSEAANVEPVHNRLSLSTNSNLDASLSNERLGERLGERIEELQKQLRSSTVKADIMQSKISALEQQLEAMPIGAEFLPNGQASSAVSGEALVPQESNPGNRGPGFGGPDNDVQYTSLISAGVDPLVAEQIIQRGDQWTLQRLELVDQATREGWRRSEQFSERLTALQEERPSIREELGDSNYDRYLFASGEFNRVKISSIINGSAAQIAGMENGDVVLSYANNRVFTSNELQTATREGSRGESVQLEVLRLGEQINIELPRGPMGVTLTGTRVEPSGF